MRLQTSVDIWESPNELPCVEDAVLDFVKEIRRVLRIAIDVRATTFDNSRMSTETIPTNETMARMQEAADKASKGIRDPRAAKRAAESMDRISEEIRRKQGVLNIAVPFIRESRDA